MPGTIHSRNYRSLLALLRELREEAGLSQVELARRLRQPQSWVSKVESAERRLDVEELRRMCDALGTDLEQVVRLWLTSIKRPDR